MGYWHKPGRWNVAPWNYDPEVLGFDSEPGSRSVHVIDSTLRSIITSEPGAATTAEDLVEIAWALSEVGVQELVFNVVHGGEISDLTVRTLARIQGERVPLPSSAELHVTPDNWQELMQYGRSLKLDSVQWAYGAGPNIPGYTGEAGAIDLMENGVEYLLSKGQPCSVAYNVLRSDNPSFAIKYLEHAARLPVRSLRLYDTNASMSPRAFGWLVRKVKEAVGAGSPPLIVHVHNTWGLAVASTIEAVLNGADGVDLAVNGVGTKGGHTPMAETVLALEALYGIRTGIRLERLTELARLVADRVGVPLPVRRPVVGPDVFIAEQAGQVMAAYRERDGGPKYDTPWAPGTVGQQRRIVWGRNTIKTPTVRYMLQRLQLPDDDEHVEQAKNALFAALDAMTGYPVWLEEDEVRAVLLAL